MLTLISAVLSPEEVSAIRQRIDVAHWVDGRVTAGSVSAEVKHNRQLAADTSPARELANELLRRLGHHPQFISAALPHRIHPPLFNRYAGGEHYGTHVDSAIMPLPGTREVLRTDLSATLFLCAPEDYDGGELCIETAFGAQEIKLNAGDLVLYPSCSLHRVAPVHRGERVCAFFWLQSMVREHEERSALYELDQTIQSLRSSRAHDDPDIARLLGVYHNLMRRFAEV